MNHLIIDVYENREEVVKLGMVGSGYAMPFQQYLEIMFREMEKKL